MQNMSLGSLSFITGPTPSQQYGCTVDPNVQGLDAPDYRMVQYPTPGQDYARVSQAFYDARTITLQGYIIGQNPTDYIARRQALSTATAINRNSYNYPTLTRLQFTTLDGNSYFTNVQPKKPVFAHTYNTWTKYQLTLVAPDGRLYGTSQQNSGQITTLIGGGFVVPTVVPVVSSGSSGGSVTVTNSGTAESHPILTFVGPLTNPYIVNQTTGYAFQLNYTILGGDSIVVDMYEQSVVYNNSSNFISYRNDPISSWWTIVPGSNTIALSTSNSSDGGYVEIQFYSAWVGL
ncbi:MAG TPA: hypothetical protein VNG51_19490 [Ktedonobacteraceae bacterium]|nr:hypothetical protein [Ktedonobacteraceae bacterium]